MILSQLFDALFLKYIQRKFSEILEKQILLQKKRRSLIGVLCSMQSSYRKARKSINLLHL